MFTKERIDYDSYFPSVFFESIENDHQVILPLFISPITNRQILCIKNNKNIGIFDYQQLGQFYSRMFIDGDFLEIDVKTRGFNGNPELRHPDFWAKSLLQRQFNYLKSCGNSPKIFKSRWLPDSRLSDNYNVFSRYLLQRDIDISKPLYGETIINEETPNFHLYIEAVQSTWTWDLLVSFNTNPQVKSINLIPSKVSTTNPFVNFKPSVNVIISI